jgi:hypothetical protein
MNKVRIFLLFLIVIVCSMNVSFAMKEEKTAGEAIKRKIAQYEPQINDRLLGQLNSYIFDEEQLSVLNEIKKAYTEDSKNYNTFLIDINKETDSNVKKMIQHQLNQRFITYVNFIPDSLLNRIPTLFEIFLTWDIQENKFKKQWNGEAVDRLQDFYSFVVNIQIQKHKSVVPIIKNEEEKLNNRDFLLQLRLKIKNKIEEAKQSAQNVEDVIEKVKGDFIYTYLQEKLEEIKKKEQQGLIINDLSYYPWHQTMTTFVLVQYIITTVKKLFNPNDLVLNWGELIFDTDNPESLGDILNIFSYRKIAKILMKFEDFIQNAKLPPFSSPIKALFRGVIYNILNHFVQSEEDIIRSFFIATPAFSDDKKKNKADKIDFLQKLTKKNDCQMLAILEKDYIFYKHTPVLDIDFRNIRDYLQKRCSWKKYYFNKIIMTYQYSRIAGLITIILGAGTAGSLIVYALIKLENKLNIQLFKALLQKIKHKE